MFSLIVGVAAYFIVGTLVMVFHYKESGTNVVPNKNFWIQFPLLIKVIMILDIKREWHLKLSI
jgi:hypothetical protein